MCQSKASSQVEATISFLNSFESSSTHRYSLASSAYFSLYSMREALLMINNGKRSNKGRRNEMVLRYGNNVGAVVGTVIDISVSRFELNARMSGCLIFE